MRLIHGKEKELKPPEKMRKEWNENEIKSRALACACLASSAACYIDDAF